MNVVPRTPSVSSEPRKPAERTRQIPLLERNELLAQCKDGDAEVPVPQVDDDEMEIIVERGEPAE